MLLERLRSTRHGDSRTVAVGAAVGARERGAEAVEFALVVPMFLLLVFGIVDFGYMINHDTMVNNASREGAREGALNPNTVAIEAKVRAALTTVEPLGTSPSKITVLVACRNPPVLPDLAGTPCASAPNISTVAAAGGTVIVTVTYAHSWITPVGSTIHPAPMTLSKKTEMRIE